ncbi:MAG: hypothetical protein ACOVNL_12780, partial [Prochlorococcaceae cyanobacterium]
NEAVALEPVIEDVEPSPLWRASYSNRHGKKRMVVTGGKPAGAVGYRAMVTTFPATARQAATG